MDVLGQLNIIFLAWNLVYFVQKKFAFNSSKRIQILLVLENSPFPIEVI